VRYKIHGESDKIYEAFLLCHDCECFLWAYIETLDHDLAEGVNLEDYSKAWGHNYMREQRR